MKLTKYTFLLCLSGTLALQSCENFLDTKPSASYSDETVWGGPSTADAFVVQVYNSVMPAYRDFETLDKTFTTNSVAVRNACSSEARGLMTREWDWGFNRFESIRAANMIIEKAQASVALSDAEKKRFVAEGKMMRAMIYFDLAKHCGRFIWVDRVMQEGENYNLPLTPSIEDSYNKVLADINDAIDGLPETAVPGRFTKNAGRALKSEICLTAAAYTGNKLLYQEAINAVDAITGVSLDPNYGDMFKAAGAYSSPEIILAQYYSKDNTTCQDVQMIRMMPNMPNDMMDRTGCGPHWKVDQVFEGWMFFTPSQNMVDDYLVIDQNDKTKALPWDKTSQFLDNTTVLSLSEAATLIPPVDNKELVEGQLKAYKVTAQDNTISDLMYQHRDKRFGASILYDGAKYYNEDLRMCQKGNLNRKATTNYGNDHVPLTNYAWRKAMYDVTPRIFYNVYTDYHYVIFRYGRALLNKAEALLCLAKEDASKISAAVAIFNQTRIIHGGLPASTASTLTDAWTDYKRERHVDLAMEGDYYWSLLRWGKYGYEANHGIAPGGVIPELNSPATFPEISQDRKAVFIGNVQFENDAREFKKDRAYLFPIPQGQINANTALSDKDQNPGW